MENNLKKYKNILVMVSGLILVSFIFRKHNIPYLVEIACGIGLLSALSSWFAEKVDWLWLKLALGLGWVNSRILLSIVFFVFLMPLAFLQRLFTKDGMRLKKQNNSLFHERNHTYTKKDLENIW